MELVNVLGVWEFPLPLTEVPFWVWLSRILGGEVEGLFELFGDKILLNNAFFFSSRVGSATGPLLPRLYVFDTLGGGVFPTWASWMD